MSTPTETRGRPPAAPIIPGYLLIERLGEGGMAEVWLAQKRRDPRLLVVKRLLQRHTRSRTVRQRILREAQIGVLLDHPNIVRTVDAGIADGEVYITTEYLPGKDLEALSHTLARRRQPFPAGLVARILSELLAGLHAAHEARDADGRLLGLVHRDLSPRNIQLGFDGRVAVIDFGLAHANLGDLRTAPGTVLGTHRYMSPEQAIGEPLDRQSDLFTVGTIAYELFTGTWLFDEPDKEDILRAIVKADLPAPSSVNPRLPPKLDAVVMKALAHHRGERYGTAAAFRQDLEGAVPDWTRTPPALLADLLVEVFPHDEVRAREHQLLADNRVPRNRNVGGEVTREQPPDTASERAPDPQLVDPGRTAVVRPREPASRPRSRTHAGHARGMRVLNPEIDPEDQQAVDGRYELIRPLGEGGMGRVYLAQRFGHDELSVVKLIHPELAGPGSLQLERFRREGEILSRFDHPNLLELRAFELEGRPIPILETEYIAGANLAELALARGGTIPPDILLPIALDLLDGLHHAHELLAADGRSIGLVHRDISPTNMMVNFDGVAKLIDFGVAHRADEQLTAVERPLIGKLHYCSPEQALQQALDRRSDLYSFGVALFELLSGTAVVDRGLEVGAARAEVVHAPLPKLATFDPSWPPALDQVLARACAKSPGDRYRTAEELRAALDAATRPFPRADRATRAAYARESFRARYDEAEQLRDWAFAEDAPLAASALQSRLQRVWRPRADLQAPRGAPSEPRRPDRLRWLKGGLLVLGGVALGVAITVGWLSRRPTPLTPAVAPTELAPAAAEPVIAARIPTEPPAASSPTPSAPRVEPPSPAAKSSAPAASPGSSRSAPDEGRPSPAKTRAAPEPSTAGEAATPGVAAPGAAAAPGGADRTADRTEDRAALERSCLDGERAECLETLRQRAQTLTAPTRGTFSACLDRLEGLGQVGPKTWTDTLRFCLRKLP